MKRLAVIVVPVALIAVTPEARADEVASIDAGASMLDRGHVAVEAQLAVGALDLYGGASVAIAPVRHLSLEGFAGKGLVGTQYGGMARMRLSWVSFAAGAMRASGGIDSLCLYCPGDDTSHGDEARTLGVIEAALHFPIGERSEVRLFVSNAPSSFVGLGVRVALAGWGN